MTNENRLAALKPCWDRWPSWGLPLLPPETKLALCAIPEKEKVMKIGRVREKGNTRGQNAFRLAAASSAGSRGASAKSLDCGRRRGHLYAVCAAILG